jgi:pyruvate carboxylase subunit B
MARLSGGYDDSIKAMGEVVRCGGFGTSVTPVSQFYFQQAFNNVMFGPWEKIAPGYGKMVLGYYGKTPIPPDAKIVKLAMEQLELDPTDRPPIEINDEDPTKGLEPAEAKLKEAGLENTEENVFIVATCGDKGIDYLKGDATLGVRKIASDENETIEKSKPVSSSDTDSYTVSVNHKKYDVTFKDNKAIVGDKVYVVDIAPGGASTAKAPEASSAAPVEASGESTPVKAQMPGVVISVEAGPGAHVEKGDTVLVLEAMKMEMKVPAPVAGSVSEVLVAKGDQVSEGQELASISS